jgi:hypothetical protein
MAACARGHRADGWGDTRPGGWCETLSNIRREGDFVPAPHPSWSDPRW